MPPLPPPGPGPTPSATPLVTIAPPEGWGLPDLRELWHHRELLLLLVGRDLKVRYQQTVLGVIWVLLQPAAQLVIFTLVFGRLARLPSEGVPYALFAFTGLLPWAYFASALGRVSASMLGASHLITRVYFPRLVVPLATTLPPLVEAALSLALLAGLMIWYGAAPPVRVVLLPAFLGVAWMAALGVGLLFAAANVHYRDAGHVLPFLLQAWLYATPVVYPASVLPEGLRPWLGLNPMAGVVEGFRWALLHRPGTPGPELGVSAAVAAALLVSGVLVFQRLERSFADVV